MENENNITGEKFGKLTAIKFSHRIKGNYYWLFKCDCGKEKIIRKGSGIKSCGCMHYNLKNALIHGMIKTGFYRKWAHLKGRCLTKKDKNYKNYGRRGIKVSDKWLDFLGFKEDMYSSYLEHIEKFGEKETTIDRINVNGNYEKENCRWATWKEQKNNKQNTRYFFINKKKYTLPELSSKFKIEYHILYQRLFRDKMSIQKSLI